MYLLCYLLDNLFLFRCASFTGSGSDSFSSSLSATSVFTCSEEVASAAVNTVSDDSWPELDIPISCFPFL